MHQPVSVFFEFVCVPIYAAIMSPHLPPRNQAVDCALLRIMLHVGLQSLNPAFVDQASEVSGDTSWNM